MHMAWALGAPTVCLFGPVDPHHYAWEGTGVEVLYQRIYCSPCVHEVDEPPCHGNNTCMQLIHVESVMAAVQRVLDGVSEHPKRELRFLVLFRPGCPASGAGDQGNLMKRDYSLRD